MEFLIVIIIIDSGAVKFYKRLIEFKNKNKLLKISSREFRKH